MPVPTRPPAPPADPAAGLPSGPVPGFLGVSLKMYLDHPATLDWVRQAVEYAGQQPAVLTGRVQLVVLPTFVSIDAVSVITRGSPLAYGAQDIAWADRGAFTGEVSGADLAALGCRYVEVGHAERRRLFGEDDTIIAGKLAAAVRNGLTPILCVGEQDRVDPAAAVEVCAGQVLAAMADPDGRSDERSDERSEGRLPDLIIAYEPVWAIGADRPAGVDHVRAVCRGIRERVADDHRLSRVRVIYGGSAGPGLLTELGRDAVDGLFLGRFAHDPAAFAAVVSEAAVLWDAVPSQQAPGRSGT